MCNLLSPNLNICLTWPCNTLFRPSHDWEPGIHIKVRAVFASFISVLRRKTTYNRIRLSFRLTITLFQRAFRVSSSSIIHRLRNEIFFTAFPYSEAMNNLLTNVRADIVIVYVKNSILDDLFFQLFELKLNNLETLFTMNTSVLLINRKWWWFFFAAEFFMNFFILFLLRESKSSIITQLDI